MLVKGVDGRRKEIVQCLCTASSTEILVLEVMPEHVHRLACSIKGRSSRRLRQASPWLQSRLPTLWTNAYFVSTVGGAPREVIAQYNEHQKRV